MCIISMCVCCPPILQHEVPSSLQSPGLFFTLSLSDSFLSFFLGRVSSLSSSFASCRTLIYAGLPLPPLSPFSSSFLSIWERWRTPKRKQFSCSCNRELFFPFGCVACQKKTFHVYYAALLLFSMCTCVAVDRDTCVRGERSITEVGERMEQTQTPFSFISSFFLPAW